MSNIEQRVLKVIAEQQGVAITDISANDRKDDFYMDSLDDVEMVMALENEFEMEVPDSIAERWTTIKDAIAYFSERAK